MNGKVEKGLKKRMQQCILKDVHFDSLPISMERGIMSKESKGRLLIIEGEVVERGEIGEMLEEAGYEAVFAEDPESAESLAKQSKPDVLLVNVGSPVKKWVKKLKKMKAPMVVLTDVSGVDQWNGEMGDGVYEYVITPMERGRLPRAVARAVEKQRLSDELGCWKERVDILESDRVAERALSEVGRLVHGIMHNLNGPLTTVMGRAELLRMRYPEVKGLDEIILRAQTMCELIEGMIRRELLGREMGNELLTVELRFLKSDLEFKHQIEKVYRFAESMPRIEGVYGELSQAFVGIILNAVDAMAHSRKKVLTVATRADERFACVEISDTGCGIPEEHLAKIFDPLFTTKPVTKRGTTSTGNGLKLITCRKLFTAYGGEIEVDSEAGRGTKVTVRLPVARGGKRGKSKG